VEVTSKHALKIGTEKTWKPSNRGVLNLAEKELVGYKKKKKLGGQKNE